MLILRRVIYSLINILLAILVFLVVEMTVAYVKMLSGVYSPPFYHRSSSVTSRAYMVILPLIIALFDSRLMKGGFIAGKVTGCETVSSNDVNLSFIGCYLRICMLTLPILIYSTVIRPFNLSGEPSIHTITTTQIVNASSIFIALFLPVSILVNQGHQGLHDYILNLKFKRKNSKYNFDINILRTLIFTIIISLFASISINFIIINSSYYKSYKYQINIAAEHVPDIKTLQKYKKIILRENEVVINQLESKLMNLPIINEMILKIDFQIKNYNGKQYTFIDVATSIDLDKKNTIYKLSYAIAKQLSILVYDVEKYQIQLSNRYHFDLIAYEKAVIFKIKKTGGFVRVGIDRDVIIFDRVLPLGFPSSFTYLRGD